MILESYFLDSFLKYLEVYFPNIFTHFWDSNLVSNSVNIVF